MTTSRYDTRNVMVRLDRAQIVCLDTLATEIRGRHGAAVSRSGILRALISGLLDAPLDFSGCSSEDELFQAIRSLDHARERGTEVAAADRQRCDLRGAAMIARHELAGGSRRQPKHERQGVGAK